MHKIYVTDQDSAGDFTSVFIILLGDHFPIYGLLDCRKLLRSIDVALYCVFLGGESWTWATTFVNFSTHYHLAGYLGEPTLGNYWRDRLGLTHWNSTNLNSLCNF